ncbi:MAG: M56 family metallopeptidase [Novosphingobium sp.]
MALTPQRERDLAIAHELEHHRGRDLAVNIAMQPLLALHWFNPLAWAGWRALRRDQEAACDARVLAGREADTRAAYGRLIAAFACNPSPALASPLACPILHEKSIVHRLRSLTMTEPTKTRRLAGRLLIGAAALALPLTATITYAGGEEPAPVTSGKSDAIVTHGIVIIDVPKGTSPDDKDLHVRTVVRDGKTIVLKTKQPLSDAEAEARIAKAEAELPMPPMPPVDGPAEHSRHIVIVRDHSGASDASAGKGGKQEVRTVMLHAPGAGGGHAKMMHGDGAMADCGGSKPVTAVTESGAGDQKTRRVMVFCTKGGDKTAALGGMRKAREQVAADPNIPADARAEALKELDAEIARMERGA